MDRGPFHAYLLPGEFLRKGQPLPADAIGLGTFSVEQTRPKWFELSVSFTVPDLTGDFYSVGVCNDPCTIWGFREPLTGLISIVQTDREGVLLTQQQRLTGRIYALRRQRHKTERALADLQEQFDASDRVRSVMASEMRRLQDRLAATAAERAIGATPRPLLAPATGIALVLMLFAISAVVAAKTARTARP